MKPCLLLKAAAIWLFTTMAALSPQAQTTESANSSAVTANAVVSQTPAATARDSYIETGGSYLGLTNGYGYWAGGYTKAVYTHGSDVWNGELNVQHEFGDAGAYLAVGDSHTFNPDWYASLTMGTSGGGFFWPRYRTDAFLNKKWMGRKQFITTAGFGYYAAKDVHRDHIFYLGSTYYFAKPWIVEEGLYFNVSNPGTIFAPAGFVALTQGRDKHQFIVVRAGVGEEAYQLIGPTTTLTQFQSQTLTVTWRKWMGTNWGLNFIVDYYHSPFYNRGGSTFGFFKEF
ncbi:MAG TPA: YaiO family outer membrane beta-barrel protein [Terriglobales bacterium]|jgi:YaiO family outer membrane protein|nr:YaiO family outer membrane beta-barrel protein [Terriglobales bacterium]